MTEHIPSPLDRLFAPHEEAEAASGSATADDRVSDLLRAVADAEGCALVTDLTAAGYEDAVIAAACTPPPDDKRKAAGLALGIVGRQRMVWLRSSGWAAVGQANRRENKPTATQLRHRLAPVNFQRRMDARFVPVARRDDVLVRFARGVELRQYVDPLKGQAWSLIRAGDVVSQANAGQVLEGVYPDALVYENWPEVKFQQRTEDWPSTGDTKFRAGPEDATWVVAVEIELSGKNDPALDRKLNRHDIAMQLGWWQAVVWITDCPDVLTRLRRAGLGRTDGLNEIERRPGHYLLLADAAGVTGKLPGAVVPRGVKVPWWSEQMTDRNA
jgi:hypothetical protein